MLNFQYFSDSSIRISILCDDFFCRFGLSKFLSSTKFCNFYNFFWIPLKVLLFQQLPVVACTSRFSFSFVVICITVVCCFLAIFFSNVQLREPQVCDQTKTENRSAPRFSVENWKMEEKNPYGLWLTASGARRLQGWSPSTYRAPSKPYTSRILSHRIASRDPPRLIPLSVNTEGTVTFVPQLLKYQNSSESGWEKGGGGNPRTIWWLEKAVSRQQGKLNTKTRK